MDMAVLVKGLSIGFAIAAPVGPVGVLVIRRTVAGGMLAGFVSGTGAAVADSFYGAVAAFGLTAVAGFLLEHDLLINFAGAIFLLFMGIRIFLEGGHSMDFVPPAHHGRHGVMALLKNFSSTCALTLTNPATILAFVAIFSGLGFVDDMSADGYMTPLSMVIGVFLGSLGWWLILSGGVGIFQRRFNEVVLKYTHVVSGILIGGFGFVLFVRLLVT